MKNSLMLLSFCLMVCFASCGKQKTGESPAVDTVAVVNEVTQKIIHARVFVKPGNVAEFIDAARAMVDSSNMEPGCESYQLYQNPYDNTQFIFVEVWKDQAAIDAHFAMPYFTAFGPKTADWMGKPAEIKIIGVANDTL